jgi:hypothetical protein
MSTLLDVAAMAEELSTNPIAVKRLIARRRLLAAQLGDTNNWRLKKDSLDAYINAGAPDFTSPFGREGEWPDPPSDKSVAREFEKKLWAAAASQVLTLEQVQSLTADAHPFPANIDRELTLTAEMLAVIRGPVDLGGLKNLLTIDSRFRDEREVFLVNRLRAFTRDEVPVVTGLPTRTHSFFASPESYEATVAKGLSRTKARLLLWKDSHRWYTGEYGAAKTELRYVSITYTLPVAKLFDGDLDRRIPELAF